VAHVRLPIVGPEWGRDSSDSPADLRSRGTLQSDGAPSVVDAYARPLLDLRISVTDRCNFRCGYCMPKSAFGPGFEFLPRASILSFEEIARVAKVFVGQGVRKLRLTGGEPLLRRDLPSLIEMLAPLGVDLALTTNGSLLVEQAARLRAAGLGRITVSLDALEDAVFRRMSDAEFPVARVLDGISAALAHGFGVKVNCVVQRGVNEDQIAPLARYFKGSPVAVRFIEFMDVGNHNAWNRERVVPADQIVQRIARESALERVTEEAFAGVAKRWQYADGSGEIGVISSVTQPFCGDCSRARLSAEGKLYTCLFATDARFDFRQALRGGTSDEQLAAAVRALWSGRADRYSELRQEGATSRPKIEMSYIGG
jgi:cyclic pyranopterin phosphate synthase